MPPDSSSPAGAEPGTAADARFMRLALRLARRARGFTSPNPMVGAVLVRRGRIIGQGWHHRAGEPHAEIEALNDARKRGHAVRGATLYVTLEPCCTQGRTPPCTGAIVTAGIRRVVAAATDPNPAHTGRGFDLLRTAGIQVEAGLLSGEANRLNEGFNHWIIHRTPLVIVKAAMTLDGCIATARGESKWITGEAARRFAMNLRRGVDAVLVGVNTVLADDPALALRGAACDRTKPWRRLVLDSQARTPLTAKLVCDDRAHQTTIFVGRRAPKHRREALAKRVNVVVAPDGASPAGKGVGYAALNLRWILVQLGAAGVTQLLVEGGGTVNGSFLDQGLAQRVAFFYAPKILGDRDALKGVAGRGATGWSEIQGLTDLEWRRLDGDIFLTGRIQRGQR